MYPRLTHILEQLGCRIRLHINQYAGSHLIERVHQDIACADDNRGDLHLDEAVWSYWVDVSPLGEQAGEVELTATFKLREGEMQEASVGIEFVFDAWSTENYVVMPAAAYAGNRFIARKIPYPPLLSAPEDLGVDSPTIITDVPRLNIGDGPSRIQLLTRDLATPAVGIHFTGLGYGWWVFTEPSSELGDSGITLAETTERDQAIIAVTAPGVREDTHFHGAKLGVPSPDTGATFTTDDSVTLRLRISTFPCADIPALFERFCPMRKELTGATTLRHDLPFSAAWAIQEAKYNTQNWEDAHGYYSVGLRENMYQDWQVGWVGGGMSTYPLLFAGDALSRQRALQTLDFLFTSQAPSGLLHGIGHQGDWHGDGFGHPHAAHWHLIRKSSDALYFLLKQFLLLQQQDPAWTLPATWEDGTRRLADAFVRLWERYGQFGQFVDVLTGDIVVGGSTSAGIASAGLALAARFFNEPRYLAVAQAAARAFYQRDVLHGVTTGGPGEILQCPDSESAFGLLESFVVLFEVTGGCEWRDMATAMADQCASWCVSYDYPFPDDSLFERLAMHTTGSVWANVQNKHSAPGICTLSGDALWKLYRATGTTRYLELLQDLAHNITQYLSRDDRPIGRMPAGWMNERVNLSDWAEGIGEIFHGSCWCEVSCMLTRVEVPGIYVQPDTGLLCVFDHIEVAMLRCTGGEITLRLTNPTRYPADVILFAEHSREMTTPLGPHALWGRPSVALLPGETREITLAADGLPQQDLVIREYR